MLINLVNNKNMWVVYLHLYAIMGQGHINKSTIVHTYICTGKESMAGLLSLNYSQEELMELQTTLRRDRNFFSMDHNGEEEGSIDNDAASSASNNNTDSDQDGAMLPNAGRGLNIPLCLTLQSLKHYSLRKPTQLLSLSTQYRLK